MCDPTYVNSPKKFKSERAADDKQDEMGPKVGRLRVEKREKAPQRMTTTIRLAHYVGVTTSPETRPPPWVNKSCYLISLMRLEVNE